MYSLTSRGRFTHSTGMSGGQNWSRTCRHTPQGVQKSSGSLSAGPPQTARAAKSVHSSLRALNRAVRSAQMLGVWPQHSMFPAQ